MALCTKEMENICERGFFALRRFFYYVNHEEFYNHYVNYETLHTFTIMFCTIKIGTLTQEQALLKLMAWF